MSSQPTPDVTQSDIKRVVARDFSKGEVEEVFRLLDKYGKEKWEREPLRVRLAALKLADGNLERLRSEIDNAACDYRDVLGPAEYPLATKKWSKMNKMAEAEKQEIYGKDWRQYLEWKNAT